jgi:hypothetical protein
MDGFKSHGERDTAPIGTLNIGYRVNHLRMSRLYQGHGNNLLVVFVFYHSVPAPFNLTIILGYILHYFNVYLTSASQFEEYFGGFSTRLLTGLIFNSFRSGTVWGDPEIYDSHWR